MSVMRKAGDRSRRGTTYQKGRYPVTSVESVLPAGAKIVRQPMSVKPAVSGPYRVTTSKGGEYWSWYNADRGYFALVGKNLRRCTERRSRMTGQQLTGWAGIDTRVV